MPSIRPLSIPLILVAVAPCWAACSDSNDAPADAGTDTYVADSGAGADVTEEPEAPSPPAALAKGLSVREVAIFQSLKIPLASAGSKVPPTSRTAPIVAKRAALVRVYVDPDPTYRPRALTAELSLVTGGVAMPLLKDTKTITQASAEDDLDTTFNFEVPGEYLAVDTQYSVAITDPTLPSAARDNVPNSARYPENGTTDLLHAQDVGDQLKVVLVPFKYDFDGSGRLPDTTPAQINRYKNIFYARYPTPKVDITVRAPVFVWDQEIKEDGTGFEEALEAMWDLREADDPDDDVYYMGIFNPADSFEAYCQGSCVTGLSGLISNPWYAKGRASVGLGFEGNESAETAAHEVGHAHGLAHAPCGGAAQPDPSFPHERATIGSWGYSLTSKRLLDPKEFRDMMSYCDPAWISDFFYSALFDRMKFVNSARKKIVRFPQPVGYRFLRVQKDGSLKWGRATKLRSLPDGEPHSIDYLAADGSTLATATGHFIPYDHLPGGFLLVPEGPSQYVRARVGGFPSTIANTIARP